MSIIRPTGRVRTHADLIVCFEQHRSRNDPEGGSLNEGDRSSARPLMATSRELSCAPFWLQYQFRMRGKKVDMRGPGGLILFRNAKSNNDSSNHRNATKVQLLQASNCLMAWRSPRDLRDLANIRCHIWLSLSRADVQVHCHRDSTRKLLSTDATHMHDALP